MSDTSNPFAKALGYFSPFDSSDPRVNQQLRQRIALAMMARERKFPKNVGEGLSAIGDALGDRGIMRSLEQADLAQQAVMPPAAPSETSEAPAAQKTAYAPTEDVSGASATPPIIAATPQAAVQSPPPLETAPSQPASMLASQMPTGIQGVDATPLSQAMNPQPMLPPQARVPSPMEPVDPNQGNALDENIDPRFGRRRAIAGIESGGARDPYATLGAVTRTGDRAYGKYQMMGANIPSWTQAALGRSLTPQQFLADQNAQDATFDKTFGGYADKYGEEGAAKAWYAGEGGMNNPNATDQHGRLTVRGYGQDFVNRLNGGQASPRDAITAQLLARGGDDTAQAVPSGSPDQRLALAATPQPDAGIQPAPPAPPPIRPAPQPQQQVAQAQPQAIPGFVPPPPGAPQGVPVIQMNQRERDLTNWLAAETARGNPYAQAKADAAGLRDLQNQRTIRQNAANEMYKAQIARDTEQIKQRLEAQRGQAKNIADVAHTEQQTATGNIVEMPDGNKYRQDPKTGVLKPIRIEGVTDAEPILPKNEFQLKSMKHYEQMREADKIIGSGNALRGGLSTTGAQIPIVGGYLQSDAYRKERSAAERWVINKLRQESGATIGEKEIDREVRAYFPTPSDDPKTVADKTAARAVATQGMMEASGREGKSYLAWKEKKAAEAETARKSDVADAVQWLKDNPNDPKAAAVRKRLGF